jgi:hypothetical protein
VRGACGRSVEYRTDKKRFGTPIVIRCRTGAGEGSVGVLTLSPCVRGRERDSPWTDKGREEKNRKSQNLGNGEKTDAQGSGG